jgi:hypothetical protein
MPQTPGAERRAQHKERFWKDEESFNGTGSGWFKSPRTLPLILALLSQKQLTGGRDVARVYLELLSRHMDGGVIEIGNEADHAYAAGYAGTRAIRTWSERMQLLEKLGFIKTKKVGGQRYKLVLLTDPVNAVASLYRQRRVPEAWFEAYSLRLLETKEADEVRLHSLTTGYEAPANVVVERVPAPGRRAIRLQDSSL